MSSETPSTRRILVIDDNPSIHEDFGKILKSGDASDDELVSSEAALFGEPAPGDAAAIDQLAFELGFASQGREGLEQVEAAMVADTPYAVAFVDMRMPPGWDGVETIEHLWRSQPDLQIVVCTAFADYSWEEIVERLGHTDQLLLLKKPFDAAVVWQLASALSEKWIVERRSRRQLVDLQEANEHLGREISLREEMERQLRHDAIHDPLTGLPNRIRLMQRLDTCIERARREEGALFALLFMDVDDFKMINDSSGHLAGDWLLVQIADRLTTGLRGMDTVVRVEEKAVRLGGDEFVVLLEEIGKESDAVDVAERLSAILAEPFELEGKAVCISTSIGIVIGGPEDETSAEDLLRDADTAMYRAKMSGKSQFAVFNKNMHEAVIARLQLDSDMRRAIEQGQFRLLYQPIVVLESGRIFGFEALLRWHHPEHGLIAPLDFVPIAEDNSLIVPIGRWVIEESCRQLSRWNRNRSADDQLSISVNVSKRQMSCPEFLDSVRQVLIAQDLPSKQLNLEITESVIMHDPDTILGTLRNLDELGVGLHMDDFGTGHSSLACLHRFPIDVLKIDRSFVNTSADSRDYAAVVLAITTLAHNLDVMVVAEGIERPEQMAQLASLDCDYGQGYFFAKPLDADGAQAMIESGGAWSKVA